MRVYNDGYASQYTPKKVKHFARRCVEGLIEARREHGPDLSVVVRGNSGVSIAFAALMLIDFPLILARKKNDNSHGGPLEGPKDHMLGKYLILDDFTCTGETLNGIVRTINTLNQQQLDLHGNVDPRCVGLLLYRGAERSWNFRGYEDLGVVPNYCPDYIRADVPED